MSALACSNWVSLYISTALTCKCVWIAFLNRRNRSPLPIRVIRLPPERSSSAAIMGGRSASALPSFSIISVAACRQQGPLASEATGGTSKTLPYVDSCNNDGNLAASMKRDHRTIFTGPIDKRRADAEEEPISSVH